MQEVRDQEEIVVPILEETARIEKREVVTGGVRITKNVREHEAVIDEPLQQTTVQVERIPIGRVVETAPAVRTEGDTTIYPILEEVLVVEKRLMLKEELRITRITTETHDPQHVVLRSEDIAVERSKGGD